MERMLPYSVEQSILEGRLEVKQLFEFVVNNAEAMDAYSMEAAIFARIMGIGLAAMKGYLSSSMNMGPPDFHKHGTTFEGGGGNLWSPYRLPPVASSPARFVEDRCHLWPFEV